MAEEDLFGFRKLTKEEVQFLKTRKFYATMLLNKYIEMKVECAALDLPTKGEAEKLRGKLNRIIQRAGLNPWLGVFNRDKVIYIHTTRDGALEALPESIEEALSKKPG